MIALVASVTLPLWNIPLIIRMFRRKSSEDISLSWALGVWVCIILMAPQGFRSDDIVWKSFNIVNVIMFSFVTATVVYFRIKKPGSSSARGSSPQ